MHQGSRAGAGLALPPRQTATTCLQRKPCTNARCTHRPLLLCYIRTLGNCIQAWQNAAVQTCHWLPFTAAWESDTRLLLQGDVSAAMALLHQWQSEPHTNWHQQQRRDFE